MPFYVPPYTFDTAAHVGMRYLEAHALCGLFWALAGWLERRAEAKCGDCDRERRGFCRMCS